MTWDIAQGTAYLVAAADRAGGVDDGTGALALGARGVEPLPEIAQRVALLLRERAAEPGPVTVRAWQDVVLRAR
eukprot:3489858-Rhodomonas_salina.1